jgi:PTH1 family peptidyl-tRNA hydrolase
MSSATFLRPRDSTMDAVVDTTLGAMEKALKDGVEKSMSLYNSID